MTVIGPEGRELAADCAHPVAGALERRQRAVGPTGVGTGELAGPAVIAAGCDVERHGGLRPGQGGLKEEGQGNGGQGESEGRHGRIPGRDRASPGARSPRTAMRDLNWRVTRRGLPFHADAGIHDHGRARWMPSPAVGRGCRAAAGEDSVRTSAIAGRPSSGLRPPSPGVPGEGIPFRPGVRLRPRRRLPSASPSSRPSGRRAP